ncbi:exlusion protein FxsA [Thiocapsa imhoffii]|uniref:Exlusion protein FxsA n=1 Tax=Thiocapsa imhoffii TaxID=382777 RepID=A0A9X1B7D2_9GAMM|nr:exlusion protein FxsA [Thiocapsa imhoffii]
MPLIILLALLIGLPLIEIYVLIEVGSEIGALPTIGLSILTAVLGTWLVRHQGFGLLLRVREMTDRGEVPALEVLDGALLLIAGFFLLLPGFLTDAVGFLLLIPPLRRWMVGRYVRVLPVGASSESRDAGPAQERARIIEGDYRRED